MRAFFRAFGDFCAEVRRNHYRRRALYFLTKLRKLRAIYYPESEGYHDFYHLYRAELLQNLCLGGLRLEDIGSDKEEIDSFAPNSQEEGIDTEEIMKNATEE